MRLTAKDVSYAYVPGHDVLRGVSLLIQDGDVVFLLGANGSGKTTFIECLAGIRPLTAGCVYLNDRSLDHFSPRERAQKIGLVPQIHEPIYSYTVFDVVLMGRAPHLGLFSRPGHHDRVEVRKALEAVDLWDLRHRSYTQISGGERQLALIARGLAQGATCLLMDEPAAHLDPHHQHDVFAVVRRLSRQGFSCVVTSHQPNNALLYATDVVFLIDGTAVVQGSPEDAITESNLEAAYGMSFELVHGKNGSRAILPPVKH